MSKTLTRADLSNSVYREIGLSLSESTQLVDAVLELLVGAVVDAVHADRRGGAAAAMAQAGSQIGAC